MKMVCGAMLVAMLVMGSGCASSAGEGGITGGPIPADSSFAKIQIGMSGDDVTSLIGSPTNMHKHLSGKMWIPFYFGSDLVRYDYFYQGQGHLIFTGNRGFPGQTGRVHEIIYDPTDDGSKK